MMFRAWRCCGFIFAVCLCLFAFSPSSAQTVADYIDALAESRTATDSANNYAWAAMCAVGEYKMDSGVVYARKAIALAKSSGNHDKQAVAYFAMSNIYFSMADNDSARIHAQKCIEQYDLHGKKGVYYTYALNAIAGYYLNKGDAKNALNYGYRQLEVATEVKDTVGISNSYTMLSAVYDMMNDLDESIHYSKLALEMNERTGNIYNRSLVLTNLAMLYNSAGRYAEAIPYLHEAIYYCTDVNYTPRHQTLAFMMLGESHNKLAHYDSALLYLGRAERMIEHIESPEERVKLLNLYSSTFKQLGKIREAIASLNKAIDIAKEKKLLKLFSASSKLLAELSAKEGDYKAAYYALQQHKVTEDSLAGTDVQKTIAELKEQYESEKKDERIAQQKRDNLLLTGGLVLAALFTALILIQYIRQRKANSTIQRQSDKLTLLMKELHHRVKNNLQIISSLLSLQSFSIKDTAASKAVREGQQRIEAMSLIHQRLYTRDSITEINIREYIIDLVDSLQNAYGYDGNSINIKLNIADELMNVDQAIPLSLIVNELVTNAFKYAFEDNESPELTIVLDRRDGVTELLVADNGKGINIEEWRDAEGSFGKDLVQTFVKQLNGDMDIVVEGGSRFFLSIPYAA